MLHCNYYKIAIYNNSPICFVTFKVSKVCGRKKITLGNSNRLDNGKKWTFTLDFIASNFATEFYLEMLTLCGKDD